MKRILITGGAGFIGSHLADRLLQEGHFVRVLDNLEPQVHGDGVGVPAFLKKEVDFHYGDIRDRHAVEKAIEGIDIIFHQAAAVGIPQSMYEIDRYVKSNSAGTATLLQAILDRKASIEKIIVASSMSIYGEGDFICDQHGSVMVTERTRRQMEEGRWEPECPECGVPLRPVPTRESRVLYPTSIYALTKKDQEEMTLIFGRAYKIPVVALRYFNVYGSRQAVSNPYTGVVAIFAARLLNGQAPIVFEDGGQLRDFVHVSDVVQANLLAMEKTGADGRAINIGSGNVVSVLQIARELAHLLGKPIEPEVTGKFRFGDTRHCFADLTLARQMLGYQAACSFRQGMAETVEWLKTQSARDRVVQSVETLRKYGLTT